MTPFQHLKLYNKSTQFAQYKFCMLVFKHVVITFVGMLFVVLKVGFNGRFKAAYLLVRIDYKKLLFITVTDLQPNWHFCAEPTWLVSHLLFVAFYLSQFLLLFSCAFFRHMCPHLDWIWSLKGWRVHLSCDFFVKACDKKYQKIIIFKLLNSLSYKIKAKLHQLRFEMKSLRIFIFFKFMITKKNHQYILVWLM